MYNVDGLPTRFRQSAENLTEVNYYLSSVRTTTVTGMVFHSQEHAYHRLKNKKVKKLKITIEIEIKMQSNSALCVALTFYHYISFHFNVFKSF